MFPLSNGRLIRLNRDGSNGEVIQTNKTKIIFGTSILYDHHIKDIDPTKEVSCEISTDEYGRVSIANKSTNEIFVNDKPITSVRPIFNNSIIKICDGVEFRWLYKHAKENIGGDLNDADFASWSDPAKKHMKLTRGPTQRPKGRLTAHPINLYSTAIEDVNEKVQSTDRHNESAGCSVIATELNDSVFTSKTIDATATTKLVDVTQELINFDETQHNIKSEASNVSTLVANTTMTKNDTKLVDDLMDFDTPSKKSSAEYSIITVKSQPSNCSVITLSSDGSQEVAQQEIHNKSVGFDDEDMFERSISCPPSELPDDLFDSSDTNMDDEVNTSATSTDLAAESKGVDCTDKVNVDNETLIIQNENTEMPSKPNQSQDILLQNTSMEQLCSVESDDDDDVVVPETQEVFSQNSESADESYSIIDCEKSDYSFDLTNIISKTDKPNINMTELSKDESVVNTSHCGTLHCVSMIESTIDKNTTVLKNEETRSEQQKTVEIEASTSNTDTAMQNVDDDLNENDVPESEQTDTLSQSETIFSQSLFADLNDSVAHILNESVKNFPASANKPQEGVEESMIQNEIDATVDQITIIEQSVDAQSDAERIESPTVTDNLCIDGSMAPNSATTENETATHLEDAIGADTNSNNGDDDETIPAKIGNDTQIDQKSHEEIVPVATSSNLTACLSADTTQEFNLNAFDSELSLENDDTMDKLEFFSSDLSSTSESIDSGNITASNATTSNGTIESNQVESPTPKSFEDVSMAEIEITQTSLNMNASIVISSNELSTTVDSGKMNESQGQLEFEPIQGDQMPKDENEMPDTNDVQESDIDNATSVENEPVYENIESTSMEPDVNNQVDIESPHNTDNIAAFSTPAKSIIQSDANPGSAVTRSTRRRPPLSEIISEVSTPKRTPRKLNVGMASATPCKTDKEVELNQFESEPSSSATISNEADETSSNDTNQQVIENDVEPISTPAQVKLLNNCDSAITRSTRRTRAVVDSATTTPMQAPRKLNISLTPCTRETPSSTVNIQCSDESTFNNEVGQIESNPIQSSDVDSISLPTEDVVEHTEQIEDQDEMVESSQPSVNEADSYATPAKAIVKPDQSRAFTIPRISKRTQLVSEIASVTPKRTPRKFNVPEPTAEVFSEQIVEQSSEEDKQSEDSTSSVAEAKQHNLTISESAETQSETNTTEENAEVFATPMKAEVVAKCSSTITRSSRRQKPIVDVESMTPKRTPRKLNMSVNVLQTPSEPEAPTSTETIQTEDVQANDEKFEAVPETIDEQNEMEQVENDIEPAQINDEDIESISAPVEEIAENVETIDNQDEKMESSQLVIEADSLSTPAKSIVKPDQSRAFTIPRISKRTQFVSEIASVTPKRTPRKFNVPEPSANVGSEQIVEQTSEEDKQSEDSTSVTEANRHDLTISESAETQSETNTTEETVEVFATPMKAEVVAKCSSTITRSSRRQKPIVGVESMTPKRTPRKLNMSVNVLQTPSEPEVATSTETVQIEEGQVKDDNLESVKGQSSKEEKETSIAEIETQFDIPTEETEQSDLPSDNLEPTEEDMLIDNEQIEEKSEMNQFEIDIQLAQTNDEEIESIATPLEEILEIVESLDNQDEMVESSQPVNEADSYATPAKAIVKPDQSRAFTIPRISKRTQLVSGIASVTPKRTPRKFNVPEPAADVVSEQIVEMDCETSVVEVKQSPLSSPVRDSTEVPNSIEKTEETAEVFATPMKAEVVAKCSSTITRSSRRQKPIVDVESMTPKRTPRKLNLSVNVPPTPSESVASTSTETIQIEDVQANDEKFEAVPETIDEQNEMEQVENDIEPAQRNDEDIESISAPVEEIAENVETIDNQDEKMESSRTQFASEIASVTPKRTPRKFNVPEPTADVVSEQIVEEDKQSEDSTSVAEQTNDEDIESISTPLEEIVENVDNQDETVESSQPVNEADSYATPAKAIVKPAQSRAFTIPRISKRTQLVGEIASVTPKRTPRKFNVPEPVADVVSEQIVEMDCETSVVEAKQSPLSSPVRDSTEVPNSIEKTEETVEVFATPMKAEVVAKCSSTITRSSRRQKPIVDVESMTPKRTPRKLNISVNMPQTPSEPEAPTSTETIQTEDVQANDEKFEAVPEAIEDQNETEQIQTDVEAKLIDEIVEDVSKSTEEVIENAGSVDNSDSLSTPAKAIVKPDQSRAFTIPRISKRTQLVSEIASVTPKRTPRKFNVPEPAAEVISEQIVEQTSEEDKQSEDSTSVTETQNDIKTTEEATTFATPAKIEMVAKCNSTITRSSRRQKPIVDVESMTPKRTPRKRNVSVIPQTPNEIEAPTSTEIIQDKDVQIHSEIVEEKSAEIVSADEIKKDETMVECEILNTSTQEQNGSTPSQLDLSTYLFEESMAAGSIRHKLIDAIVKTPANKGTPRKLNDSVVQSVSQEKCETTPIVSKQNETSELQKSDDTTTVDMTNDHEAPEQVELLKSARSTRRKDLDVARATPKRTPRKLTTSATPLTLDKPDAVQTEDTISSGKSNEENVFNETKTEQNIDILTPAKIKSLTSLGQNSSITKSSRRKKAEQKTVESVKTPEKTSIITSPVKDSAIISEVQIVVTSPPNEPSVDKKQSEDIAVVMTPAKRNVANKLIEEHKNSAAKNSPKRKRADVAVDTPPAKRTTRKVLEATPSKMKTPAKANQEPEQKNGDNEPVNAITNKNSGSEATISDKIFDRIEAELKHIHNEDRADIVEVPENTKSNGKSSIRSTKRKPNSEQEIPKNINDCVVKVTPLKVTNLDKETPSTSKSVSTPMKKRVKSTRTLSKAEATHDQTKTKDTVDDLVAAVLKQNVNVSQSDANEAPVQRLGTPLPANKKRTGRLTGSKTKLTVESNEKEIEVMKQDTEKFDVTEKVEEKGKTSRRKKTEDEVVKQPSKQHKNATSAENVPSIVIEPEKPEKKEEKTPAKMTKRKRAITDVEPAENTPKVRKTGHNHVIAEAATTPHSLRSLRKRNATANEAATPKGTRQSRKQPKVDTESTENVETIVLDSDEEENQAPAKVENPKRQPRRKAVPKAEEPVVAKSVAVEETKAHKEETTEKVQQSVDDNMPRRTTKRTRTRSEAESVDSVKVIEEIAVKPGRRNTRQNSQMLAKPSMLMAPISLPEESTESKSKRGRPKRAQIESDESVPVEQPKRTGRSRTVSKSEENTEKVAQSEEATKEEVKDQPKTKAKRGRKVDVDVAVVENTPNVGRNTNRKQMEEIPTEEVKEPSKSKAKRTRKADIEVGVTEKPEATNEEPPKTKGKRGRKADAAVVVENIENVAQPEEASKVEVKEPPKAKAKRGRNIDTEVNVAENNIQTEEATKEEMKEAPKPKAKRTRKAESEVVDVAEKQPPPKRTRKATKSTEVETESETAAIETVPEKKSRKTKKTVESNDVDTAATPPISTRTRRNK